MVMMMAECLAFCDFKEGIHEEIKPLVRAGQPKNILDAIKLVSSSNMDTKHKRSHSGRQRHPYRYKNKLRQYNNVEKIIESDKQFSNDVLIDTSESKEFYTGKNKQFSSVAIIDKSESRKFYTKKIGEKVSLKQKDSKVIEHTKNILLAILFLFKFPQFEMHITHLNIQFTLYLKFLRKK